MTKKARTLDQKVAELEDWATKMYKWMYDEAEPDKKQAWAWMKNVQERINKHHPEPGHPAVVDPPPKPPPKYP